MIGKAISIFYDLVKKKGGAEKILHRIVISQTHDPPIALNSGQFNWQRQEGTLCFVTFSIFMSLMILIKTYLCHYFQPPSFRDTLLSRYSLTFPKCVQFLYFCNAAFSENHLYPQMTFKLFSNPPLDP